MRKRIIVGVSGASGIYITTAVLRHLRETAEWESYLVLTESAAKTASLEYEPGLSDLESLADVVCDASDLSHPIASGSFLTEGMIVVPCSMKTMAGIVSGYSDNLLLRAADVTLKERRRLIIVPRETPLSVIHCRNMLAMAELGCMIVPPVLSFYHHPQNIDDIVNHIAGKVLDGFGIHTADMVRWGSRQTVKK